MKNYNPKTTDRGGELLMEVDKNDRIIGSVTRKECHNETRRPWHRSTHAYLFDKKGLIYLSKRSSTKDTGAGMWTVSAGGHIVFGQTAEDTIHREIHEELGVTAKLKQIDKLIIDYGSEREIVYIFAGTVEGDFKYNKKEVEMVKGFDFDMLIKDFTNGAFDLSNGSRDSLKHVINTGSLKKFRDSIPN